MEKIIQIEDLRRKKFIDKFMGTIGNWYDDAANMAGEYYALMLENPNEAIKKLPDYIDKARDIGGGRGYEAFVGPNQDWTAPMMDIVGIMYPTLPRESRELALNKCLGFLDLQNYFISQLNVELINEPWLVADILINRWLYNCGYKEYITLLEKNKSWKELEGQLDSVKSEFWFAYAVLQPRFSSLDVRSNFYRAFPELVNNTKDAIAAIALNGSISCLKHKNECPGKYLHEMISMFDAVMYDDIVTRISEEKWIKLEPFY